MSGRPTARSVRAGSARKLRIAAAVAREALLDVHVVRALELVELARGRVEAVRMLDIYRRLHHLDDAVMSSVSNRVLAILGEQALETVIAPVDEDAEAERPRRIPARTLRGRLRALLGGGRVHFSLRRQVDLHTGRTEIALMQVHAEHALRFADILLAEATADEAVAVYREMLGVRDSLHETLYFLMLSRMSEQEAARSGPGGDPAVVPPNLRARGLALFS